MALSFFLLLMLGHMIGDFTLQPYWLVLAKRAGWRGLLIHVGVVTFITAILAWASIPYWWVWVILLYIGHLFIDQFRTFVFTDNSRGKGLLLLVLDQLAHMVLIGLLAWAAIGWTIADLRILLTEAAQNEHRLITYLIGLAMAIGMVPVLEAEITVAVWAAQGREVKKTIAINTSDRLLGSLERIGSIGLILAGYGLLVPLLFAPRLIFMIRKGQFKQDRTAAACKLIVSFAAAVIIGFSLTNIPPPVIVV